MKKISTAAAQEIEKVEGQKLTVGLDLGRPIELVLRSGGSRRRPEKDARSRSG